ncbi:uncharacterized protein LOC132790605 [Drosophila nasuta]|uniref:uncharacterized protein LOC132790605 n=1 Tax=Drosophila nasuta TaxID=42062 RepID=UPI00295E7D22|nr:uncharacterized protein LOC132790605 [Drosophila nasuta]
MCAVRIRGIEEVRTRLEYETRRRQWRLFTLLLFPLALQYLHGARSLDVPLTLPTAWPDATLDECHDEYQVASANASNHYAFSFQLCELTANETKIDLTIHEELEREQIERGRIEACGNLELCETLDSDLEYFACVRDSGTRNLELMLEINNNATSAYTRLREDYNELQQTFVLCTLEAQVAYMQDMREAYAELQECRQQLYDSQN